MAAAAAAAEAARRAGGHKQQPPAAGKSRDARGGDTRRAPEALPLTFSAATRCLPSLRAAKMEAAATQAGSRSGRRRDTLGGRLPGGRAEAAQGTTSAGGGTARALFRERASPSLRSRGCAPPAAHRSARRQFRPPRGPGPRPAAASKAAAAAPQGSPADQTRRAPGGETMSRRKQTTPNKVHWKQVFASLEERTRQAMMRRDLSGLLGEQPQQLEEKDSSSSDSEGDEETTQDEVSSHTSEEDGPMTKVKQELASDDQLGHCQQGTPDRELDLHMSPDALTGLSHCPLCQLECASREQLVTHVYQHTAAVVSAKSYLCPVCGRALGSPGSLGRHLLIHSEDQLSNCAVCGARFTSHATFNSEKVPEVLCAEALPIPAPKEPSGAEEKTPTLNSPAVYPAGLLLVCNGCVAYRKLLEAQSPGGRKWALRRQNEPLEVRMQRLERERTAKKSRRDNETPEEREVRRMRDREAKRLQRMQETDEQRARRLQRDREAMRLKRANETPEKRQARLIREREAKRLKRRLEKMDMMLRAQFGQDPSAMATLAAEINFFPLPVGGVEMDSQLLSKMAFEEPSPSALH